MAAQGFLGAGDLYVARIVGGVQQAWKGPYETSKFEITTASELKRLTSKGKTTYGQIVESVPIGQPPTFAAEFVRVDKESLILAFLGTEATESQSASTVSNESVAVGTDFDAWYPLSKFKISNVVVTNTAGSTTYVEGTDYLVNRELGWLKVISGGAITASSTVHVDFSYAASTAAKIRGATNSQLRAAFKFDGVNQVDNLPAIVDVWEAVLTSSGAFDFLADDFNKVPLTGELKTPVSKTEPFVVTMRNTVSPTA